MISELLQKYIWLIQTLIRAGERGLPLEEISFKWENRFGTEYARSSFNNHRGAIEEIFGISIECDRSTKCYKIASSGNLTDEDAAKAWLINTFTVNNLLSMSKDRLGGRVAVEDIPSGQKHLTTLMEAMTDNAELSVAYRKYSDSSPNTFTLHPYGLKEWSRRWYLVAFCKERNAMRVYGLDRIISIEPTGKTFKMKPFNIDEVFATSYGPYLPENPPTTIVFRATASQARYLRDLPLHNSQKEISDDGENVTFSIFASANLNLMMDLQRLGSKIEVISPQELRDQLFAEVEKMYEMYRHDE